MIHELLLCFNFDPDTRSGFNKIRAGPVNRLSTRLYAPGYAKRACTLSLVSCFLQRVTLKESHGATACLVCHCSYMDAPCHVIGCQGKKMEKKEKEKKRKGKKKEEKKERRKKNRKNKLSNLEDVICNLYLLYYY
jgi:6-phosphofructokinase